MINKNNKQAFSDRFNEILDKAGIPPKGKGRQGVLAKLFDVSDKGARKWIEAESIPRFAKLTQIVEKFKETGATIEWLLTGNPSYSPGLKRDQGKPIANLNVSPVTEDGNTSPILGENRKIPLINWSQAWQWRQIIDDYLPSNHEIKLLCPVMHGKHTFALRVRGDAMVSPYLSYYSYPEGAYIFVDPDREVTNGCRVIAKMPGNNEFIFKEYREDDGKRYLKPLNPQYPIREMTDQMEICGVVIGQFKAE
jgi:SOS-response transcriptional repressor LexA